MARPRIGILFGGIAEEHPIAVKSAREVDRNLDVDAYEPYWIGIRHDGTWTLCDGPDSGWETSGRTAIISPDRSVHGVLVFDEDGTLHERIHLDAVFPVLHGQLGEDGAVQGLLELSGIPYVGSDVQSSAICMDKSLAYAVVTGVGITVPKHKVVWPGDEIDASAIDYPVFVKPARSGSSFGVSKVTEPEDLPAGLETARQYDPKVLIEEAINGKEIGCSILGSGKDLIVGELDHVAVTHGFFRIHQEASPETGSDNSTFIVPADIPDESRDLVQRTAMTIYRALGCSGLARVDTFLLPDGSVVLNEVNTIPGLTSYSRYPRMMAAGGIPFNEVIDRLLNLTLSQPPRN